MYPHLLSQILRGNWFLRPEDIMAGHVLVHKLLDGGFSNEKYSKILSESKPITQSVYGLDSDKYDKAPRGSTAIIPIHGTMIKYGTWCSYGADEIAAIIRQASNCENISSIVLSIDSGGGACDSVAVLVQAIEDTRGTGKPVVASCDMAASAAYWIATACDRIIADNNISSSFGSIGVMCSFADVRPVYEKMGYVFHEIYADPSSDKNEAFNLALKGEYDKIRKESLNPLAIQFQETVKANRPGVNAEIPGILSGKMFYAKQALEYGLIDDIGTLSKAVSVAKKLQAENTINNYINS